MNKRKAKNDFKAGLKVLLEDIDRALSSEAPDPYAGAGKQTVLEHTTRIYFLDRFLELLGWRLGLHGNVAEEARIKAGTTAFMDYLGVNETTRAPALLVEAKAWDTPFIAPRSGARFEGSTRDLLLAAIQHVRNADLRPPGRWPQRWPSTGWSTTPSSWSSASPATVLTRPSSGVGNRR